MKYLLLLPILLLQVLVKGQSAFNTGFNEGFKRGYCYNDYGCIPPIPPITPIPNIGESYTNYTDGYNRGFQMGLDSKRANTSSNTNIYKPVQKPDVYKPISDDLYILAAQEKYRQAQIQRSNIIEDRINRINKFLTHLQGLETAFNKCYPNDTGKMEIIEKELSQYTGEDYLNDANYKQVFKYLHEWEEYFAQNVITCQNANR